MEVENVPEIKAKLVRKIEHGGAWYSDKYELECIKCGKHYLNGRYDSRTNPYCNDCKREIEKERNRVLKEEKRKRIENSIQKEEVKHWFEFEIAKAEEYMKLEYNPMFNGVEVGHEKQIELNKAHIQFCRFAIMALCKEETKMCEACKCGKGNLSELKSETIHFGNSELSLDLIFGFEESGKGKIVSALFDSDGYPIKETTVYTEYCPMCGRKLEK